jgi:hypothetical protein
MFTKAEFAVAVVLVTAFGGSEAALAQQPIFYPNSPSVHRTQPAADTTITNMRGRIIGADPDANVRLEMRRDHEHYK